MIHVIGDIVQSVGVVLAAILIFFFGGHDKWNAWDLCDPICTYLFSVLVMMTTFPVSKDCIKILMESAPPELDLDKFT